MQQSPENWASGITFDDVLLVPKRSAIRSRKETDLRIDLGKGICLNLPIISSPMDTVTESEMAVALARAGALGVVHRFNTIEEQSKEVEKVKRKENHIIEKPLGVGPDASLAELLEKVESTKNSSFLVLDGKDKLLGIVTRRDYAFEKQLGKKVFEVMTPFEKLIYTDKRISLTEASDFFNRHKVEKLPIVDEHRKIQGLITAKDVVQSSNSKAARDGKGRLLVGAAVGVKSDDLERAESLVASGSDALVLDIAHGHLEICLDMAKKLHKKFPETLLIVGNVATRQAALDLRQAGADVIKVGIGPGAVCTTRIVTGFGVPQLTAVMEAKKGSGNVPVIADGGIRSSGDMAKALAAGASGVMIGSLLAGTDESPGKPTMWNGRKVKLYRGMASYGAYKDKMKNTKGEDLTEFTAEGVDMGFIAHKGAAKDLLNNWEGGLKSAFSYAGAHNLKEFWQNVEFMKISPAGMKESHPHDVTQA